MDLRSEPMTCKSEPITFKSDAITPQISAKHPNSTTLYLIILLIIKTRVRNTLEYDVPSALKCKTPRYNTTQLFLLRLADDFRVTFILEFSYLHSFFSFLKCAVLTWEGGEKRGSCVVGHIRIVPPDATHDLSTCPPSILKRGGWVGPAAGHGSH